jgi:hypothetical protein
LPIEFKYPYQAVWYRQLLLQPWPPPWRSGFLGYLADAAGRAGRSRSRRAAAPYLAATVASIAPRRNFHWCQ